MCSLFLCSIFPMLPFLKMGYIFSSLLTKPQTNCPIVGAVDELLPLTAV